MATIKNVSELKTTSVNIYLIDTITGNIIYHTYYLNTNGPVIMAQVKNL